MTHGDGPASNKGLAKPASSRRLDYQKDYGQMKHHDCLSHVHRAQDTCESSRSQYLLIKLLISPVYARQ